MIVRCPRCDRVYDDARCWTICPHQPLEAPPSSSDPPGPLDYCREHDLFNCPNHRRPRGRP